MIDPAVAGHFEILGRVGGGDLGICRIEGVSHANTFDRPLGNAIDRLRYLDASGFEDGGNDINHMMELTADRSDILDVAGPRNRQSLAGATEVRGDLLGPLEGGVEGPRPADRHVRIGFLRTPLFEMQELQRFGSFQDTIVSGELVVSTGQGAFRAGAVVATDIDDQRVVEFTHVLDLLDHAVDLIVGIGCVTRKGFRLALEKFLFQQRDRIPLRDRIRPRRELGIRWDHAELLLVGENHVAQFFITHVELAFELLNPFRLRLVRRVGAAWHIIDEERLVRCGRVQIAHVLDRLVRQIGG